MRMSQSSARAKPPASAGPLTAATTGRGQDPTASKAPVEVSTNRRLCSASPPNSVTSMPAQKAGPRPGEDDAADARGPRPAPLKASASSSRRSIESALRFSGPLQGDQRHLVAPLDRQQAGHAPTLTPRSTVGGA